jgi:hypothetical protein
LQQQYERHSDVHWDLNVSTFLEERAITPAVLELSQMQQRRVGGAP